MMQINLKGQRILVTGASRGIGHSIVRQLIGAGAVVAVHYNNAKNAATELAATGEGSIAIGADLSVDRDRAELIDRVVDALGGIDCLVNNAGIALSSPIDEPLDDWAEKWSRTQDVNLLAAAVLSREAINVFRRTGGGRLIFVASRAAFRGDTIDYLAYAASKGGMVSLSRSIARGFGKDGVKSFVVAPGFVRTEMAEDFIRQYGDEIAMRDIALDRLTEPGDVAPIVAFLASGMADHATGTSIDVNAASYVR